MPQPVCLPLPELPGVKRKQSLLTGDKEEARVGEKKLKVCQERAEHKQGPRGWTSVRGH